MYSTCLDECGWCSAEIPPLTSILSSCNEINNNDKSPAPTTTIGEGSGNPSAGGENGGENGGGNTFGNVFLMTVTELIESGANLLKSTGGGNSNSNENGNIAINGVDDKDKGHDLLFRMKGVILAGFVVYWIFGWF